MRQFKQFGRRKGKAWRDDRDLNPKEVRTGGFAEGDHVIVLDGYYARRHGVVKTLRRRDTRSVVVSIDETGPAKVYGFFEPRSLQKITGSNGN
ncbi:MAG: hypothetical protein ACRD2P_17685 [Terriglobia bacterium]